MFGRLSEMPLRRSSYRYSSGS
uniref:Uncharacterized protein n=1 Tax=Arundo donax TaxID=35708 RepID=A0A0A8ZK82_ARUDO